VTGDVITITGAVGARYNGTFTITVLTVNTFRYTIVDNPASPGTGGTATVGSTTVNIAVNGIVRLPTAANNTSQVNVTATTNLPSMFAAGAKVTIVGALPIAYNVVLATILDGAKSNACGGAELPASRFSASRSRPSRRRRTPAPPPLTAPRRTPSAASRTRSDAQGRRRRRT
jgi:hypothetical protein